MRWIVERDSLFFHVTTLDFTRRLAPVLHR